MIYDTRRNLQILRPDIYERVNQQRAEMIEGIMAPLACDSEGHVVPESGSFKGYIDLSIL